VKIKFFVAVCALLAVLNFQFYVLDGKAINLIGGTMSAFGGLVLLLSLGKKQNEG
jgi:hypothetical protein